MKQTVRGLISLMLIAVFLLGMLTVGAVDIADPADTSDVPTVSDPEETGSADPEQPDPSGDPIHTDDPETSEEPEIPVDVTAVFYDTDGQTVLKTLVLKSGETVPASEIPALTNDGLRIGGWRGADVSAPLQADTVFTAESAFGLDRVNHISYISGYKDYTFRPNLPITRAEAAKMLSRLLVLRGEGSGQKQFSDVAEKAWYTSAVTKLASINVIRGYKNGTFVPNGNITRAEFVVMLSRLFRLDGASSSFSDVKEGSWYYKAVAAAAANGWISGYKDGTFRPDDPITRAEAVTIMNRVLGRFPDHWVSYDLMGWRRSFVDVPSDAWYAGAVVEAAVRHDYWTNENGEHWTSYQSSTGLSEGIIPYQNSFISSDANGLFVVHQPGLVFYNGKHYHVTNQGLFIDYVPNTPTQYADGMFCGDGTGAVLVNANWGHLYFGEDGKYSSGNAELDGLMANFLAECTDASMSKEQKLRAVYLYMRDSGRFGYLGLPHYGRGTTDWAIPSAIFFLKMNKGNCYCWAGTFCYAARALGFDAYVVSGGVPSGNVDHAWTMIHWSDGVDYLFDIELEWGHLHGYYSNQYYQNRYKLAPGHYPNAYYFP